MTANRSQMLATMTTRQKVTLVLFVAIVLFLLYQIYGLFGGSSKPPPAPRQQSANRMTGAGPTTIQPSAPTPAAQMPKQNQALSGREVELLKMQQESEARYISALNELQMLKISRDIAELNKAIMTAKLDTITAEKNIVDLLKPPPPVTQTGYAQGLVGQFASGGTVPGGPLPGGLPTGPTGPTTTAPTQGGPLTPPVISPSQPEPMPARAEPTGASSSKTPPSEIAPPPAPDANYTVISVSQLHAKWSAVLGLSGRLWSVYIGDIVPADQSKVVSIDRTGVVLERNGVKRKVSLVPLI